MRGSTAHRLSLRWSLLTTLAQVGCAAPRPHLQPGPPDSSWLAPARYHLQRGMEWVGCAPLGLKGPVFAVPTQSAGANGAANSRGLCPERTTLVHTHWAWDKAPSAVDCRNLSARHPEYDIIILADTTWFRYVQYDRCK